MHLLTVFLNSTLFSPLLLFDCNSCWGGHFPWKHKKNFQNIIWKKVRTWATLHKCSSLKNTAPRLGAQVYSVNFTDLPRRMLKREREYKKSSLSQYSNSIHYHWRSRQSYSWPRCTKHWPRTSTPTFIKFNSINCDLLDFLPITVPKDRRSQPSWCGPVRGGK